VSQVEEEHQQLMHYNRHIDKLHTDWVLIADLDEFVYARKGYGTIPAYLRGLPDHVKVIGLPWKNFGSSGNVAQPRSVIMGMRRRAVLSGNAEIKSLFRTSRLCNPTLRERTEAIEKKLIDRPSNVTDFLRSATPRCILQHHHRASFNEPVRLPDQNGTIAYSHETSMHGKQMNLGRLRARMDDWGLHLNHYSTGSCEYWAKVGEWPAHISAYIRPSWGVWGVCRLAKHAAPAHSHGIYSAWPLMLQPTAQLAPPYICFTGEDEPRLGATCKK
jgi:hypothetical protein